MTEKRATEKYWMGDPPTHCDMDGSHIITTEFVDGRTRMGPWANMCPACHTEFGSGVGMGRGQHYRKREEDGRWLKIAG